MNLMPVDDWKAEFIFPLVHNFLGMIGNIPMIKRVKKPVIKNTLTFTVMSQVVICACAVVGK